MEQLGLLLLISFLFGCSEAINFELSAGKQPRRCFVEDLGEQTSFRAKYKVKQLEVGSDTSSPGAVFIVVTDPNGVEMLKREYKDQGSFVFLSSGEGTHEICFWKVPTETSMTSKVNLFYELQENANSQEEADDDEPKDRETNGDEMKENEMRENEMKENSTEPVAKAVDESPFEKMLEKVDEMYSHVHFMYIKVKKQEKHFRKLSKTTNSRIIWWAIFQVIVLLLTAAWQMRHLTKFFILKKIV